MKTLLSFALLLLNALIILGLPTTLCASEYEDFIYLNVDYLASSGTESTLPESPRSFIANPASISKSFLPIFSHSHSARHFPKESMYDPEMDQLDSDIESIILPLPIGRFGYAFSLKDELGYDYTNHPEGRFGFPPEKLEGSDTLVSYALGGFPLSLGASLRRFYYRYYVSLGRSQSGTRYPISQPQPFYSRWTKEGQTECWGILAGVPSIRASFSSLKTEVVKLIHPSGFTEPSKRKQIRLGIRLFPVRWLSSAVEVSRTLFSAGNPSAGKLDKDVRSEKSFSINISPAGFLEIGIGNWNGNRSFGVRLSLGGLIIKYSEVKDMLRKIIGKGGKLMQDLHFYGFTFIFI